MLPMGNMFSRISDPKTNVIRNKRINSLLMPPKSHLDSLGLVKMRLDRTADTGFQITDSNPKYLHNSIAPIRIFQY